MSVCDLRPRPTTYEARSERADVLATAVPMDRGSETLRYNFSDLAQVRVDPVMIHEVPARPAQERGASRFRSRDVYSIVGANVMSVKRDVGFRALTHYLRPHAPTRFRPALATARVVRPRVCQRAC